jgi:hypothetical protein
MVKTEKDEILPVKEFKPLENSMSIHSEYFERNLEYRKGPSAKKYTIILLFFVVLFTFRYSL